MSPKPIRTGQSHALCDEFYDFSLGICNGRSDLASGVRHLRHADNVVFDERRALGVRKGYRDVTDYALPYAPHSLMKYYAATNKVFAGAGANIYSVDEATGYAIQTPPAGYTFSGNWWHSVNINSVLVATQEGGTNAPMAYNGTAWLSLAYAAPDSTAMTIVPASGGSLPIAGGPAAPATVTYRVRHLFSNGASTVSGIKTVTITNGSGLYTAAFTTIPVSARSDYTGFQIERQKQGDAVTWYYVGAAISPTQSTYSDGASDASLGTIIPAQPGPYGAAPHFDNLFVYRGRIFGISGTTLYPSQAVADTEAPGCGCFNFNVTRSFPVTEFDDGDAVVAWAPQSDRIVLAKGKSGHALAGFDFNSFYMTPLWHGMGAAGSRAMTSHGNTVYFYDTGGQMFRLDGANTVTPWGKNTRRDGGLAPDVSDYLANATASAESRVTMVNYLGKRILVAYPSKPSTYNNEVLAFRVSDGTWEHYTNIRIADALVQARNTDFAAATMIFADPLLYGSANNAAPSTTGFAYVVFYSTQNGVTPYPSPIVQKASALGVPAWGAIGNVVKAAASSNVDYGASICYDSTTGGCVVAACADYGGGTGDKDIYLQRYNNAGTAQWGAGVKAGSTSSAVERSPQLFVDSSGVTFCAWTDGSGTSRIQKYAAAAGAEVWTAGGVVLGAGTNWTTNMIPDGAGGFYVAWLNIATNYYLYATRIKSDGTAYSGFSVLGTFGGTHLGQMNPATITRVPMSLTSDGGILLSRNLSGALYAIKISPAGVVTTSANISDGVAAIKNYYVAADASGGGYVAYQDSVASTPFNTLWARALNSSMVATWSNKVGIHSYGANSGSPFKIVKDGDGGFIHISYSHASSRWVANRVNSGGSLLWGAGTALSASVVPIASSFSDVALSTDGAGGCDAYFAATGTPTTLVLQRIDSFGVRKLGADGVVVSTMTGSATLNPMQASFTGAAQGDVVASSAGGYHLWSAFSGQTDAAPRNTSNAGDAIPWLAGLPEYDSGEPDTVKEIEAVEVHSKKGVGTVNCAITMDATGRSTAIPVQVAIAGATWGGNGTTVGSTLYWGPATGANPLQPHTWGGDTSGIARAGTPGGMLGRKYTVTLTASVSDDLVLSGVVVDYKRRPDRTFARTF